MAHAWVSAKIILANTHKMQLTPRQQREKQVYDSLAAEAEVPKITAKFPLPNREHSDFFPFFLEQIGEVRGKKILEIGSGSGYLSCWLARQGAEVVGIDISEKFCAIARQTAEQNNCSKNTGFRVETAENLSFPDEKFDLVVGNQILHHLEIPQAAAEIQRVLQPHGRAVFCEPMGLSGAVEFCKSFIKKTLRHADHRHTPDEKILDKNDFAQLQRPFGRTRWRAFQLFVTKLTRFWPSMPDWIFYPLLALDKALLRVLPFLKTGARLAVIVLEK